jgi:hypothetical protein
MATLTMAYADPPYVGMAKRYEHHPDYAGEVDQAALIGRLIRDYPDGWALSCHSPSLRALLPLCPERTRVAAWTKRYTPFRPGVGVSYAWEPVLICGGRRRSRKRPSVRDWVECGAVMHKAYRRAFFGEKPEGFCFWLFEVLGLQPGDHLVDLFPGSGAVTRAWERWQQQLWPSVEDVA